MPHCSIQTSAFVNVRDLNWDTLNTLFLGLCKHFSYLSSYECFGQHDINKKVEISNIISCGIINYSCLKDGFNI